MGKKTVHPAEWRKLLRTARAALKNAHAEYSHYKVGAALRTRKGQVFSGCNVENTCYGLSNCAERTAIFSAVAQLGPAMEIAAIAIAQGDDKPCTPCGACRQVIYEFGPNAVIYYQAEDGWKSARISKLLPDAFRAKTS